MNLESIYTWGRKTLKDMTLNELSQLRFILDCMPDGIEIFVNDYDFTGEGKDETYRGIEDYIEKRTKDMFSATHEDYENLVGKCFMKEDKCAVVKVVGLSKKDSEFLYEQFEKDNEGMWHLTEYNWLQDTVNDAGKWFDDHRDEYLSYCLTPYTDLNINMEGMFWLGVDGNLYIDYSCGGDYYVYKPMKESMFEAIREEAIENDREQ